ncbi:pB438L [African swine fever virus]|uniref:Minor capsid protein p49 n=1 Tax=African swine fever virus TaxID=10497 RepID=A0A0C5AWR2_ASF|nr:BA71V-B438L (p49) [African swine fever virus]AJL34254.1 BA71V-B438L (p49) [African swine fever virus]AXB49304.1 pB438L [African swine fever virus]AXB49478.1 pB438L [African swine fever virus]AXB49650.1 pB438L [African swine fever virus]AXB49821.1 pB438L [African swine fever virus]
MYHDYASKLLADYRSDPPLWESDLPRHNRYSDNILNARYCGNKNGAAPVYNECTNSPGKAEKGLQLSDLRNFSFMLNPQHKNIGYGDAQDLEPYSPIPKDKLFNNLKIHRPAFSTHTENLIRRNVVRTEKKTFPQVATLKSTQKNCLTQPSSLPSLKNPKNISMPSTRFSEHTKFFSYEGVPKLRIKGTIKHEQHLGDQIPGQHYNGYIPHKDVYNILCLAHNLPASVEKVMAGRGIPLGNPHVKPNIEQELIKSTCTYTDVPILGPLPSKDLQHGREYQEFSANRHMLQVSNILHSVFANHSIKPEILEDIPTLNAQLTSIKPVSPFLNKAYQTHYMENIVTLVPRFKSIANYSSPIPHYSKRNSGQAEYFDTSKQTISRHNNYIPKYTGGIGDSKLDSSFPKDFNASSVPLTSAEKDHSLRGDNSACCISSISPSL